MRLEFVIILRGVGDFHFPEIAWASWGEGLNEQDLRLNGYLPPLPPPLPHPSRVQLRVATLLESLHLVESNNFLKRVEAAAPAKPKPCTVISSTSRAHDKIAVKNDAARVRVLVSSM